VAGIITSYYTSNNWGDIGEKLIQMPRPTASPRKPGAPAASRPLITICTISVSIMSLADTAEPFSASDLDGGGFEALEAKQGAGPGFESALIPLDEAVQVFREAPLCAFGRQAFGSHLRLHDDPAL
jgi:hypothetical protein